MKPIKRLAALLLLATLLAASAVHIHANEREIMAAAYVLIDAETGAILRARNEHQRISPASMMKVLTAILLVEHLPLDEIFIVGEEISYMPPLSSRADHSVGDAISGENMLRSIMMPSGNDTSIVAALQIMLRITGEESMPYTLAEALFASLMNERARELGAFNSNFTNPHGFHHPNQFTTAYDLALIAQEALGIEPIARIAREPSFRGPSALSTDPDHNIATFDWRTFNELLLPGAHHFPYATGLRTGWHDQAGPSVIATAYRNGRSVIAVISNSPTILDENYIIQNTRWDDARTLLEYGLSNFVRQILAEKNAALGSVNILNQSPIEFIAAEEVAATLRVGEPAHIERRIEFNPELIAPDSPLAEGWHAVPGWSTLVPLIAAGDVIGTAAFYLDGQRIAQTPILAATSAMQPTTPYQLYNDPANPTTPYQPYDNAPSLPSRILSGMFSLRAIPFWLGFAAIALIVTFFIIKFRAHDKWQNDYSFKNY